MKSYSDIRKELIQTAANNNIPILGEFELTSNCNLNCEMCYVHFANSKENNLSLDYWKSIFNEAVNNGMLFALLTGGEIFSLSYFEELYNYLYDLGVKITLYTNGTLINEENIQVLVKRPPEFVGITMYGASNETYYEITKNKNGFDLVCKGIDLLQKNKINILLRTIAIPKIMKDLDKIIDFAKQRNLKMGYSLYVGKKRDSINGDVDRLTPKELIEYENKFITEFNYNTNTEFRNSNNGFSCAATKSSFFVNHKGYMMPCSLLDEPKIKLTENNFKEAWDTLNKSESIKTCDDCLGCDLKSYCITCKARLHLEGNKNKCSPYLKRLAILRKEVRNG